MFQRLLTPSLLAGLALFCASCSTTPTPAAAPERVSIAEPANLFLLKQELRAYIERGDYESGVATVANQARAWVEQRARQGGDKLAIVLDIDETALSNLKHMLEMDFGYVPALWDQWIADADGVPIAPVLEVFRTARANNVAVFFMTGRKTTDAPGTIRNLRETGLGDYAGLHFKPNDYAGPTQTFKTDTRRQIVEAGYTIIANIGDQHSDLDGGFAERTFKLPNPFYITK